MKKVKLHAILGNSAKDDKGKDVPGIEEVFVGALGNVNYGDWEQNKSEQLKKKLWPHGEPIDINMFNLSRHVPLMEKKTSDSDGGVLLKSITVDDRLINKNQVWRCDGVGHSDYFKNTGVQNKIFSIFSIESLNENGQKIYKGSPRLQSDTITEQNSYISMALDQNLLWSVYDSSRNQFVGLDFTTGEFSSSMDQDTFYYNQGSDIEKPNILITTDNLDNLVIKIRNKYSDPKKVNLTIINGNNENNLTFSVNPSEETSEYPISQFSQNLKITGSIVRAAKQHANA